MQDLKLIQKTRKIVPPVSPTSLSLTGRKAVRTLDDPLTNDSDEDADEILEFERKIRREITELPSSCLVITLTCSVLLWFTVKPL